jgi:outer membrane protein TolC
MASEAVRLQQINYGSGGSGVIGLLDAQRQYQQAQLGYVRAEAQRYQDTVQLLVAMGGGWWDQKLASRENNGNPAHNVPQPD